MTPRKEDSANGAPNSAKSARYRRQDSPAFLEDLPPGAIAGAAGAPRPSLPDLLDWSTRIVERLCTYGAQTSQGLLQRAAAGRIVITTSFSGLGGAETAAAMLASAVQAATQDDDSLHFEFWSATDFDKRQQTCLLESPTPMHVFENVLDRIPIETAQGLSKTAKGYIDKYVRMEKEAGRLMVACRGSDPDSYREVCNEEKHKIRKAKAELSGELLARVLHVLSQTEFKDEATTCLRHPGRSCPLKPCRQGHARAPIWIEIAGPVCKPWSRIGHRRNWLDPSAVPCLTWIVSMRLWGCRCRSVREFPLLSARRIDIPVERDNDDIVRASGGQARA